MFSIPQWPRAAAANCFTPGGSGTDFCLKAVENNVLVIPGSVFSERDTHFRVSFAAPDEILREGVEILNSLA